MNQIIKNNEGLQRIAEFLKSNDGFVLICHISPDGDTLGSALALYDVLKLYGKRVQITCDDRVPRSLMFLPNSGEVLHPDKTRSDETAIAIDCGDLNRLGKCKRLFDSAKNTISIDHHGTNPLYAMQNEVFGDCAATAEIIYELIRLLSGSLTHNAANCLYTGLMTDTGAFAFNNVTPSTFLVAAELVKQGADSCKINERVYRCNAFSKTKLLGFALSSAVLYHDSRTALCIITQADMARCKAKADDTEGIIDKLRDIEGVEVAVLIRECLDGDFKASFRSKDYVNVAEIGQNLGGGGHMHAAGCKVAMTAKKLADYILTAIEEAYNDEEY